MPATGQPHLASSPGSGSEDIRQPRGRGDRLCGSHDSAQSIRGNDCPEFGNRGNHHVVASFGDPIPSVANRDDSMHSFGRESAPLSGGVVADADCAVVEHAARCAVAGYVASVVEHVGMGLADALGLVPVAPEHVAE